MPRLVFGIAATLSMMTPPELCAMPQKQRGAPAKAVQLAMVEANKALENGEFEKVFRVMRKADPNEAHATTKKLLAHAHNLRGIDFYERKKLNRAFSDFRAADRLMPGQETILQSLGIVAMDLKRSTEAERFMKKVLKLNPFN